LTIYEEVIPTALKTAISLDYSIIFAVIEDTNPKKHSNIAKAVITEKMKLITLAY